MILEPGPELLSNCILFMFFVTFEEVKRKRKEKSVSLFDLGLDLDGSPKGKENEYQKRRTQNSPITFCLFCSAAPFPMLISRPSPSQPRIEGSQNLSSCHICS